MWDAAYMKCRCPILIRGTLNGKHISRSTAGFLPAEESRSLEAAQSLALLWQRHGREVHPEASRPLTEDEPAEPAPERPSIDAAVAAFLADARDRSLSEATVSKRSTVFENNLRAFARAKGLRFLSELSLALLREWRASWNVGSLVRSKRQKSAIGFLWFCERAGWFPRGYASEMTEGLGKIEVKATQTGYFAPEEYRQILDATYLYSDRPSISKHNSLDTTGGVRIRTLTELMRWTGLRIRDSATLEKHRLTRNPANGMWSILLYQRKTGEPVYCPIPPHVAEMLLSVPPGPKAPANNRYFFWTGAGKPKTLTSNWERSYQKLFALAGLKEPDGKPRRAFPHMFRDTFAVESLLAGVPLVEVSKLLGHTSIRTTEKHYMPWVRARQTSLNEAVAASWVKQGIVAGAKPRRAAVVPIAAAR